MSEELLSRLKLDRDVPAAVRRKPFWRRWLPAEVAALVVIAAVMMSSGSEQAVETVSVASAYPYQSLTLFNATGYVVAQRKAAVSTKATGRLEWLGVQEGSVVRAGEVIARLESRDVAASLDQARANVGAAEAELQDAQLGLTRARDLLARHFIAQSAFDAAQARFDKARAALGVARAGQRGAGVAVEQTEIRAPFDGVVLTKSADIGDIVTPFSSAVDSKGAVMTMADMATLEVEADVSEASLSKISVGQPCEIAFDAFPELRLRGDVSRLVPTVDRSKASVLTKIRFVDRDPRVLPGMSIKVAFLSAAVPPGQRKPFTAVNPAALAQRDGKSMLFVVRDGVARAVPVKPGAKLGDLVAVNGVTAGDKVVLNPADRLRDGDRVIQVQK